MGVVKVDKAVPDWDTFGVQYGPCRELDALVAEKVMGLHVYNFELVCEESGIKSIDKLQRIGRPLLHYSTSIADAWLVVEELSGQFAVNLSCTSQPVRWLCEFSRSENVWFNAHGRTPAEAICLAALKAIGYHDESH